jgi:hypothetical protein
MLGLPLAACTGGVLDPQAPIGAADTKTLLNALWIIRAIVVPTIRPVVSRSHCSGLRFLQQGGNKLGDRRMDMHDTDAQGPQNGDST